MALARPQPGCHFVRWSFGTRLVARVLLPLPVRCVFGSPSCSSPVCCAPRVASGCYAGRSGLSVRRPALLRALRSARLVRFWRRALRPFLWEVRRACDPNPNLYTAHARAAASALRCARARFRPLLRRREGARVARRLVARSVALRVVRAPCSVRGVRAARQATWLILPVVICLSQRLSHACLSISDLYCETANGSLNQLWFL
jgi:hypothetical protein